ncbi:MAG: YjgP/YjgQ family permease [Candidatus Omnitrophica bacterium]|nr:YjgP/YjgQ family permease [Candidatus Omnitrophota bacterium]
MRIIRNYILKESIVPFVMCLGVLTFIFLLGYLPQLANKVINQGVGLYSVSLALLYNIPILLSFTLPIASLATVILTFGRLSSDNEIIALRASGIPLTRLLMPLIILGLVLSLFLWLLNDRIIPHAYQAQRALLHEAGARNPSSLIEAGTFIDDFTGHILFIYRIEKNRLYNVRIYQPQTDGKPTRTIIAQEGEFTPVPGEKKILFKLINGTSDEPDFNNPNNFYKLNFKTSFMTLDLTKATGKADKKPKGMTLKELSSSIAEMRKQSVDPAPLLAEYHRKTSWAFSPLIFILLGFPAAVVTHRRQKTANLMLAILFAAPYYLLSVGCQALATQGLARPELVMWLPNLLGGIVVLIMNRKLCVS